MDLYSHEIVVKTSAKAVVVPLKDCISFLNRVYEALIGAEVHPITEHCSNYDYIRNQIVQVLLSLEHSDQAATACLRCLDEHLETLTQDEGKLEQQKNATEYTLADLRTKQASNKKLLKECLGDLEQAETNLRSIRDTLESQERRVQNAKMLGDAGLRLVVIPVFGWIAGGILMISSAKEMVEASHAIEIAEEEMKKSKSQVNRYTDKVCGYKSKIFQIKFNIGVIDHRLGQIRSDIHMMKKQRYQVSNLQRKTRRAVHLLSVLSGKVNVFEKQTRRFILREPVMQLMDEVMKSTEEITRNELLHSEGMLTLVEKMRKNNRNLRAICASQNDEDVSFLLKYI